MGGHALAYESPEDCLLREVREETGLTLTEYRFRGIVTFALKGVETQYMCLYTATGWEGELNYNCPEGVLEWVERNGSGNLPCGPETGVFFRLLQEESPFFSLKLSYDGGSAGGVRAGREKGGLEGLPLVKIRHCSQIAS